MVPAAAEVARRRWTIVIIVRAIALLTALGAVGPLLAWLSLGLYEENLGDLAYYAENFAAAAMFPIAGYAILRFAERTARFLVPMRRIPICPGCNYQLEGLTEPRCPECGLALTAEFLGAPPPPGALLSDAAWTFRARAKLAILLRLAGLAMVPITALSAALSLAWLLAAAYDGGDAESVIGFVICLLWTLFCAAFNAALLLHARRIAVFLAPGAGTP